MFPAVVVAEGEIAVILRQPAAAHLPTAARDLHHLVAHVAHHRQTVRGHRRAAEDAHLQVIARGLDNGSRGALPPHIVNEETLDETSHGLQAPTAEGCLSINHDLLPLTRKQAHQRPGCPGRDPALRHAATDAQDQAVHGL